MCAAKGFAALALGQKNGFGVGAVKDMARGNQAVAGRGGGRVAMMIEYEGRPPAAAGAAGAEGGTEGTNSVTLGAGAREIATSQEGLGRLPRHAKNQP